MKFDSELYTSQGHGKGHGKGHGVEVGVGFHSPSPITPIRPTQSQSKAAHSHISFHSKQDHDDDNNNNEMNVGDLEMKKKGHENENEIENLKYQAEIALLKGKLEHSQHLIKMYSKMDAPFSLQQSSNVMNNNSLNIVKSKDHAILEQEKTIHQLQAQISAQQDDIKYLNDINEKNMSRMTEIKNINGNKSEELKVTEEKLREAIKHLASIEELKTEYDRVLFLNDQLKVDNMRLMQMMAQSPKFKSFFEFNKKNHEAGGFGLAFVPSLKPSVEKIPNNSFTFSSSSTTNNINNIDNAYDSEIDPSVEINLWIPEEALRIGQVFQNNHLPNLSVDVFGELLLNLNRVWLNREQKKIKKLKKTHEEEIIIIKRQFSNAMPYDEVVSQSKVNYLKKELNQAKSPIKGMGGIGKGSTGGPLLESTVVTVEHMFHQLEEVKKENKRLFSRLEKYSRTKDSVFMEGAAWLGKKLAAEENHFDRKIGGLSLAFQQKISSLSLENKIYCDDDDENEEENEKKSNKLNSNERIKLNELLDIERRNLGKLFAQQVEELTSRHHKKFELIFDKILVAINNERELVQDLNSSRIRNQSN